MKPTIYRIKELEGTLKLRLRHDKYQGWQVTVGGCPRPMHSLRMVYLYTLTKGWNRRVSASVALWTTFGLWTAFRYASAAGYPGETRAR